MLVVFSDVHANREALSAVLEAALGLKPEKMICLGDIVGYGPDPAWCLDAVRSACDVVLCGNHDFALVYGSKEFSASAETAIRYHRALLMPRMSSPDTLTERQQRWDFLKGLSHRYAEEDMLFVHGSPRNPVQEYLRESDVKWGLDRKLSENFAQVQWLAFVGHTHRPGVITADFRFLTPAQLNEFYRAEPGEKAIINVGSVGQPRDGDPRAAFVTVDGREVRYHRVLYDVEKTVRKIERTGTIDLETAERLRSGL
jgi:diadenosine tetraphosphatase ApaH/serine/threonine PP2A family protein phosphatase